MSSALPHFSNNPIVNLYCLQTSQTMGSFSSAPKIQNDDNQDNDIQIPINFGRFELLQYCQTQPQVQPMVKRAFKKAGQTNDDTYGFKCRKLNAVTKGCSDYVSSPYSLRVFQWNILSQALGQMNDHFVKCPDEALEWNSRKFRIIEEIVEYCPDIICLQEVDHFNFLKYILGTQGYTGVFYPKPDSPCVYISGNNGPDGCAIFYRTNKFDVINIESRILEIWRVQSNQVALLANLRIKETGQEVCVTTTHLKARQGAFLSTLRNEQGKDLLQFVSQHCGPRPVVICGDFNAEPIEPIYSTILSDEYLNLGSAYADCDSSSANSAAREPPYTTWKIRDEGEVCHTIDYIFYKKGCLEVEAVLELPTGEEIGEDRVPSFSYPSDHFSLVCDFKIGQKATL
ncbi:nocturnin isoform X3 [Tribolium castaneum]|uniref:nocturnin isoform X3 n=1 Tax=Tribolium castaneum TaxID=7070 RepID=UPI00046C3825|nr:PREDICTED: nocturnin isoform X3 [Tribolium castaneum]|eukprot:XP_008190601.1 PREDICTED: nocturnin isoform X3 [Tribolium castaneum]